MLGELVIAVICTILCATNLYMIAIFFIHRHQLTPKTVLQANLAVCNLLSSYYLAAATVDEAFFSSESSRAEQSTGWNMTLCTLSTSSWALTSVLWYHINENRTGPSKRTVSWTDVYGFVGGIWLYFTVLVLVHVLSIYGWTFDSHDTGVAWGWVLFVLVPFLLPWALQAWIFIDINPVLKPDGVKTFLKEKWQEMEKRGQDVVGCKDEMVVDSKDEMVDCSESQDDDRTSVKVNSMAGVLNINSNLFFSGFAAVIISTLATKVFFVSTNEELLPKFFIALVCVTWINCSVSPYILFTGEMEIESSRQYIDSVIYIVSASVRSYVSLYVSKGYSCGRGMLEIKRKRNSGYISDTSEVSCPINEEESKDCQTV